VNSIRALVVAAVIGYSAISSIVGAPRAMGQAADKPPQDERRAQRTERQKPPKGDATANAIPPDVAALRRLSLVLGRPTDKSVTASVLCAEGLKGYCEYGIAPGDYTRKTAVVTFPAGEPVDVVLDRLPPDKQCFYRLRYRKPGEGAFAEGAEHSFHTQRAPGSAFAFALQGDSHPEREGKMYDPGLYAQTMRNVAKDPPDFYLTLGDDFSIENLISRRTLSQAAVDQVYARQRAFLGAIGCSSALFLVNGNHEQAALCNLDGTAASAAVMAGRARTLFFPLPAPDAFYGGNAEEVEHVGLLRDYYSWTWGDALFVVIDPYWHSPVAVDNVSGSREKSRDLWAVTLGDAQYRWLTKTLTESNARWKFVFCHHVLGTGRGGIEQAGLFEWGGKDKRGVSAFAEKRPGWERPIHDLMVKTGVTILFQGHDHLYARQELDGVVYPLRLFSPQNGWPQSPHTRMLLRSQRFAARPAPPRRQRRRATISWALCHVSRSTSAGMRSRTTTHSSSGRCTTLADAAKGFIVSARPRRTP
jgi:hypothetical protein